MKTKYFILSVAVLLAACSQNDSETPAARKAVLEVNPQVAATRAVITGTYLPYNSSIGVCLQDTDDKPYADGSTNLRVNNSSGRWVFDQRVELTEAKGRVTAYYPYNEYATGDSLYISCGTTISSQQEYLYTPETVEVDVDHPAATLQMHFALPRITLRMSSMQADEHFTVNTILLSNIRKNQDENEAPALNTEGFMNHFDGGITKSFYDQVISAYGLQLNLTTTPAEVDVLVLPAELKKDYVQLTIGLSNGEELTTTIPATTWEKGKQYIYPIQIHQNKLYIGEYQIVPRGEAGEQNVFVPYSNE